MPDALTFFSVPQPLPPWKKGHFCNAINVTFLNCNDKISLLVEMLRRFLCVWAPIRTCITTKTLHILTHVSQTNSLICIRNNNITRRRKRERGGASLLVFLVVSSSTESEHPISWPTTGTALALLRRFRLKSKLNYLKTLTAPSLYLGHLSGGNIQITITCSMTHPSIGVKEVSAICHG